MIGALVGDIVGSRFEFSPTKTKEFELFVATSRFTDDSVMTMAVVRSIVANQTYKQSMLEYGRMYPRAGYGGMFRQWLRSPNPKPYNSWGNGSAMRVSPIGWAFETEDEVLSEAAETAAVTHSHPEGIKGAQATALAVFMARNGLSKERIRLRIEEQFEYDLSLSLDEIRPDYSFEVSCQGSVPQAIIAFLESESVEDAVRNAISLGGDADTQAAIAGPIAEAFYGPIDSDIVQACLSRLDNTILHDLALFSDAFLSDVYTAAIYGEIERRDEI